MIGSGFVGMMLDAMANVALLRRRQHIGPGVKRTSKYRTQSVVTHTYYNGALLRQLRAEHGVGRPPAQWRPRLVENVMQVLSPSQAHDLTRPMSPSEWLDWCKSAVVEFGSQRKAAAALGITLGKLQRTLKKVA